MDIAFVSTDATTTGTGLQHAVSLGNIEITTKSTYTNQMDRSYDSEDEHVSRRRLRHTQSSDLHARTSVYSRGDIREQYCLTDRQLNSIERVPRRERLFGCLSRRSAQQTFLGGCVGRRAPSDENLAGYAPFIKYPRYQSNKTTQQNLESNYFRQRQPASILSTGGSNKMLHEPDWNAAPANAWLIGSNNNAADAAAAGNDIRNACCTASIESFYQDVMLRNYCLELYKQNYFKQIATNFNVCSYHCPAYTGTGSTHNNSNMSAQQQQAAALNNNARTKHVSFARSHTLTSFDNMHAGFRSSARLTNARSQERLIGGKKPIIASGSLYETMRMQPSATLPEAIYGNAPLNMHQPCMHVTTAGTGHAHQHHHAPFHIHQQLPDNVAGIGMPTLALMPTQSIAMPQSPEVVIVEKKFRNAMKTQATQTDVRKDGCANLLALSPRSLHRVKVVSQGAQTNGLQNGKKLTKSLSEMLSNGQWSVEQQQTQPPSHECVYRMQSTMQHEAGAHLQALADAQNNIMYYKPPPPLVETTTSRMARTRQADRNVDYVNMAALNESFDYESNSLPRRTCSSHARTECDYYSNSLPRHADALHAHDICKHITECSELMTDSVPLDFTRPHLLPPPSEYCRNDDVDVDVDVDDIDAENEDDDVAADDDDDEEHEENEVEYAEEQELELEVEPELEPEVEAEAEEEYEEEEEEPAHETESYSSELCAVVPNRRMSMMTIVPAAKDTPFRRDDIRRQSMPIYGQTEKLIDGFGPRSSFRHRDKISTFNLANRDEREIIIDFKPHMSPKPSLKLPHKQKRAQKIELAKQQLLLLERRQRNFIQLEPPVPPPIDYEIEQQVADAEADGDNGDEENNDENEHAIRMPANEVYAPVYENITQCLCKLNAEQQQQQQQQATCVAPQTKREQFRKRSVSLDDDYADMERCKSTAQRLPSTPASPCREDVELANASTYPSTDSLANDNTRDHSDGIWNESQATVLTAEQKDISDASYSSNLLLTPTTKRKNLLLQHQQRSSIDTDVLDFEEQSPTYAMQNLPKIMKTPHTPLERASKTTFVMAAQPPAIAVTPSNNNSNSNSGGMQTEHLKLPLQEVHGIGSPVPKRASNAQTLDMRKFDVGMLKQRQMESADVSECSTNTDEYATCTDTSKRTPGIKTPPTTTSSSSTTQVPVSTQSSQLEKTHGGSSFESASSLHSIRNDVLNEDLLQHDDKQLKTRTHLKSPMGSVAELPRKSPSHSISSTSSGSYNMAGKLLKSANKQTLATLATTAITITTTTSTMTATMTTTAGTQVKMHSPTKRIEKSKSKIKPESISDDERSELRYSSSGYYESPHDDDDGELAISGKMRRKRLDEEHKRRKTNMKLNIEKENLRALTSPIKKAQQLQQQLLPEQQQQHQQQQQQTQHTSPGTSPGSKMKRFRPKIRRQLRKSSRDENTSRRMPRHYAVGIASGNAANAVTDAIVDAEMLPDASIAVKQAQAITATPIKELKEAQTMTEPKPNAAAVAAVAVVAAGKPISKSNSEICQLKAKSIESLRSVSPGSDSVFYSEADGGNTTGEQHSHCFHCGKEMDGKHSTVNSELAGDSVESLPFIEQVADIVKPPSDFADSPVTTKTTQRLYKKMEKRFRSEERYHGERGRHYKSRQENIRAKSEERGREHSIQSPSRLRLAGSSPCVLPDTSSEQNQNIIYRGHYDAGRYARLTDADVWTQLNHQSFDRNRERRDSTDSEKSFHAKYQVILHRLVQRRCTLEMYQRQKNNTFRVDKTIVVKSASGEFGFRIHGSKPVVVAAIEPETPAESSGLEVGDIIISVNGVQVLDKHHTEVVKIAHDGCEILELQVARTIGILMHEQLEPPARPIYSGYLWRQSGQSKSAANAKKWVRRWFSLRPDNCLYYYKTEEDTQPVGAMIMVKHTVELCAPEIGKPYAFKLDAGDAMGITMYVAADSEELTERWLHNLRQAAAQDNNQWLDKSARCLYQSPGSIVRPDCFGYLLKLGSRWCGWSKRYCVLKDACLYFYQDANSKSAFGMACLHGYKVASMSINASGKKYAFEIIPPEMKLRHYYFCSETEMDKKRWISALEYSIDRWIKSG